MAPSRSVDHPPGVLVQLTVHPELERLAATGDPLRASLRVEVARGLGQLLRLLGIPGVPEVVVRVGDQDGDTWAVLTVNGRRCRPPRGLEQRARRYVLDGGDASSQLGIVPWLRTSLADPALVDPSIDFCRIAVVEAVKVRPSMLLGPAQAAAYSVRLTGSWEPDWTRRVLWGLLDLKRSIGDVTGVGRALRAVRELSPDDALEEAVARLGPTALAVRLPEPYLRELTQPPWGQLTPVFGDLRAALFEQLGVPCPPLRFTFDNRLRPRTFCVTVNDVPLLPWQGLGPQQCLVDDSAERVVQAGLEVLGLFDDPLSGSSRALIRAQDRAAAEQHGWNPWGPLQLLSHAAAIDLMANAPCLLDEATVRRQLELLEHVFPALAGQARAAAPLHRLAPIMRALVAEAVGVRNLSLMLERLLDADDPAAAPVDRLVAWVRPVLTPAIVHRHAGRGETVAAWIVDPELEALIRNDAASLAEGNRNRILAAFDGRLGGVPAGVPAPVVVTSADVRLPLRRVVAEAVPQLSLLSYEELPVGADVRPVGRIALRPG